MPAYVLRRLWRGLITMFGVLTGAFFLQRLHGDPAITMLPTTATHQDIANLNHALGFDRPLLVQYGSFIGGAVHGNFGSSLTQNVPALSLVLGRLPASLELSLTAFTVGCLMAFVLVMIVQLTDSHPLRMTLLWLGQVRQAIPTFLFGILLILLFSVKFHVFPSFGRGGISHLVLPALTLGTYEVAMYVRTMDSSFGEQAGEDYIRTALSKGSGRGRVILRHALPNALLPIVTLAGLNLGGLLGGAVIIETVFNWPGVGQLTVQAVNQRDFPVVLAGLLVVSLAFVLTNLFVDLLYSVIDPKVRVT